VDLITAPGGAAATRPTPTGITARPLPAHRDDWERRLLGHATRLGELADGIGGPFHVVYPDRVIDNVRGYQAVLAEARVSGAVYYARKANKSGAVIEACARADAGVDVSSPGELRAALGGGVRGRELMITGPAKGDRLLWTAVRHGAVLAIDALDGRSRLIALAPGPARVLLRVRPAGTASRFGLADAELDRALGVIGDTDAVGLEGFSFHLPGYDIEPRVALAGELIERCRRARDLGHPASLISIGGGFAVDYVDRDAWATFLAELGDHWFHGGRGIRSWYPYHSDPAGPAVLARILAGDDLAARLRGQRIRLAVEPGRSLLDRAGVTVFRVRGVKTLTEHGRPYRMITVDGTSLSLSEQWFAGEYPPDPVLWPAGPPAAEPVPCCVGGATCLEDDLISRRRIPLPREPRIGDLLVYPNTAGYQMDSNESAFQNHPIPPKVVLGPDLGWRLDHETGDLP